LSDIPNIDRNGKKNGGVSGCQNHEANWIRKFKRAKSIERLEKEAPGSRRAADMKRWLAQEHAVEVAFPTVSKYLRECEALLTAQPRKRQLLKGEAPNAKPAEGGITSRALPRRKRRWGTQTAQAEDLLSCAEAFNLENEESNPVVQG
jgi:hypothetical protein